MKNLNNTTWSIHMASDWEFYEERMVYNSLTFLAILDELHTKYGEKLVIDFDDCEIYIYDDCLE
jgi:hypothetical protein